MEKLPYLCIVKTLIFQKSNIMTRIMVNLTSPNLIALVAEALRNVEGASLSRAAQRKSDW